MIFHDFSFQSSLLPTYFAMVAWYYGKYLLLMMLLRYVENGIFKNGLKTESESYGRLHRLYYICFGFDIINLLDYWVDLFK